MSSDTMVDRGTPFLVTAATATPGDRPTRLYPALAGLAGMFLGLAALLLLIAALI